MTSGFKVAEYQIPDCQVRFTQMNCLGKYHLLIKNLLSTFSQAIIQCKVI